MRKRFFYIKLVLSVSLLLLLLPQDALSQSLTQQHSGGEIEIDVSLLNPEAVYGGDDLLFDVSMNTHTVSLDKYKTEDLSYLKDEKGRLFKAQAWESPKGGGHHRFGKLRFPGKDNEGKSIIGKDDLYIEVIIRDIGGIEERVFRWKLPFMVGI